MSYIVDRLFIAVRAEMYLPYVESPQFYSIATVTEQCHFSPCASHFSMNHFAVGLSSGNLCSTLLQGAEALPAIDLLKYSFDFSPILQHCQSLVRSNTFIFASCAVFIPLLSFFCPRFFLLSAAGGSWSPC